MIESPVVSIHIPPVLRSWASGAEEVTASGETVAEALESMGHEYPALLDRIVEPGGGLRPYMNVYLRGVNVLSLDGLDTAVAPEDVLTVISMNIEEMAEATARKPRDAGRGAGPAL